MKKYLLIFLLLINCDYFNNPLVVTEEIVNPYTYKDPLLIGIWELYPPYEVLTKGSGWILELRRDSVFLTCYRKFEVVEKSSQVGVWNTTNDLKFRFLFESKVNASEKKWEGVYDYQNGMLYLKFERYFYGNNTFFEFSNILKKR